MAIKQSAINRIAYAKSDPRNRTRMERGLYDGYNSLPGEILTIRNPGYRNVSIRSDKRTLYGAQHVYHAGWSPPNYPVPAIDYYNSSDPSHLPIGNVMEWSIPVNVQLKFRT